MTELERPQAENEQVADVGTLQWKYEEAMRQYDHQQDRAWAAEQREARLRGALQEIASGPCRETREGDFDDPCCDVMIARAALSETAENLELWLGSQAEGVRQEERERCAKVAIRLAENHAFWDGPYDVGKKIAAAIRNQDAPQ